MTFLGLGTRAFFAANGKTWPNSHTYPHPTTKKSVRGVNFHKNLQVVMSILKRSFLLLQKAIYGKKRKEAQSTTGIVRAGWETWLGRQILKRTCSSCVKELLLPSQWIIQGFYHREQTAFDQLQTEGSHVTSDNCAMIHTKEGHTSWSNIKGQDSYSTVYKK